MSLKTITVTKNIIIVTIYLELDTAGVLGEGQSSESPKNDSKSLGCMAPGANMAAGLGTVRRGRVSRSRQSSSSLLRFRCSPSVQMVRYFFLSGRRIFFWPSRDGFLAGNVVRTSGAVGSMHRSLAQLEIGSENGRS